MSYCREERSAGESNGSLTLYVHGKRGRTHMEGIHMADRNNSEQTNVIEVAYMYIPKRKRSIEYMVNKINVKAAYL